MHLSTVLLAALLALAGCSPSPAAEPWIGPTDDPHATVRGMTVSTPTYGPEWGTDAMADTLDVLAATGANWIAYHPYARLHADGTVAHRLDPEAPPGWLVRPIREAHARGLKVLVKPHLAHWGSGFSWRGEVAFDDPVARARFHATYRAWIVAVAEATAEADALSVGTELKGTVDDEAAWRQTVAAVRAVHPGLLTYAANWDAVERVPFWDALDVIGVQAYFPVLDDAVPEGTIPSREWIEAGWAPHLARLRALSERTGKPVVFSELGYDRSPAALHRPWASGSGGDPATGRALQRLGLEVALDVVAREPTVRGAFLWKWFPGELQRGDFRMSDPALREVLREGWASNGRGRLRPD